MFKEIKLPDNAKSFIVIHQWSPVPLQHGNLRITNRSKMLLKIHSIALGTSPLEQKYA
jgi:hypothetical protein